MKEFILADEDYRLWGMIVYVRRAMSRAWSQELQNLGLSVPEAAAMFYIETLEAEATPANITRLLYREPNTTTALLNRMEKKGLINKTKDLARKNMIRISLTPRGRTIYDKAIKRRAVHRIVSCLSEEERKQLESSLLKLYKKSLKEMRIDYKASYPLVPIDKSQIGHTNTNLIEE